MQEQGPFVSLPCNFKIDGLIPYYKAIPEHLEGQSSLEDNTCICIVWAV